MERNRGSDPGAMLGCLLMLVAVAVVIGVAAAVTALVMGS